MRGKYWIKQLALAVMLALGIYNILQAASALQRSVGLRQQLLETIGIGMTRQAVSIYMPGLYYTTQAAEDPVILEDESTCESILELNGQTLAERLLGENQGRAVAEENEAVLQQQDPEEADEKADVEAITPSIDLSLEALRSFDYLLERFFVVDPNTVVAEEELNIDKLMAYDLTIHQDASKPQILIYHTHSQEQYIDSDPQDPDTGVVGVGEYLATILREDYGYQVIHDTQHFDVFADGSVDRSKAYNAARSGLKQILEENPSLEVIIDLHRDGVPEDRRLVTEIDGKPTAQIMYFNGLSYTRERGRLSYLPNDHRMANLAFSFRLEYKAVSYYPDLTRCVYLKGYRYNLDLRPKSLLLEVGAQNNTVEEARNAMEPFAFLLHQVLQGE